MKQQGVVKVTLLQMEAAVVSERVQDFERRQPSGLHRALRNVQLIEG